MTLSGFTEPAVAEASKIGIELVDNLELTERLERAGATELLRPSENLLAGHPCRICGAQMILDRSPSGWWLRCPRYRTGCKGKQNLDRDPQRALEVLRDSQVLPS